MYIYILWFNVFFVLKSETKENKNLTGLKIFNPRKI